MSPTHTWKLSKRRAHKKFLWEQQGGRCAYCRDPMTKRPKNIARQIPSSVTIDHLIPKSRGGTNGLANLVLCCASCNMLKGNRMPIEFFFDVRRGA